MPQGTASESSFIRDSTLISNRRDRSVITSTIASKTATPRGRCSGSKPPPMLVFACAGTMGHNPPELLRCDSVSGRERHAMKKHRSEVDMLAGPHRGRILTALLTVAAMTATSLAREVRYLDRDWRFHLGIHRTPSRSTSTMLHGACSICHATGRWKATSVKRTPPVPAFCRAESAGITSISRCRLISKASAC